MSQSKWNQFWYSQQLEKNQKSFKLRRAINHSKFTVQNALKYFKETKFRKLFNDFSMFLPTPRENIFFKFRSKFSDNSIEIIAFLVFLLALKTFEGLKRDPFTAGTHPKPIVPKLTSRIPENQPENHKAYKQI